VTRDEWDESRDRNDRRMNHRGHSRASLHERPVVGAGTPASQIVIVSPPPMTQSASRFRRSRPACRDTGTRAPLRVTAT
jgi:hypothetical protein